MSRLAEGQVMQLTYGQTCLYDGMTDRQVICLWTSNTTYSIIGVPPVYILYCPTVHKCMRARQWSCGNLLFQPFWPIVRAMLI